MEYIDLTLENGGGDNAQLFDFKWAESSPGAGWVEADGQWISSSSKSDAYNELVNNLSGINSQLLYVNNYSANGTLTIDNEVASGFGNGNYIESSYVNLPSSITNCEFIIKVKPADFAQDWNILWRSAGAAISFKKTEGRPSMFLNNLTGWVSGGSTYNANDVVWIKLYCEPVGSYIHYYLYSLLDDNYTLATLPTTGWTLEKDTGITQFIFAGSQKIVFGYNTDYTSEYFNGEIDLTSFRVKLNGDDLFHLVDTQILNNNGLAVYSSLDNPNVPFYAIVDTANTRFKLPNPDYYIPADKPNLKLYFWLG